MYKRNQRDEVRTVIESKLNEIKDLLDEYEELDGNVKYVNMLHFDDDEQARYETLGYPNEITNLVLSNRDLMALLTIMGFVEVEDDE